MSKVKNADELALVIKDGATVAVCGMGLAGWNEEMAVAIEKRFLETGHPQNITLFQNGGTGDWTINRGPTHFGHVGLVKDGLVRILVRIQLCPSWWRRTK